MPEFDESGEMILSDGVYNQDDLEDGAIIEAVRGEEAEPMPLKHWYSREKKYDEWLRAKSKSKKTRKPE